MNDHEHRRWMSSLVVWRARLETLPRPAEVERNPGSGQETAGAIRMERAVARRYATDRMEMYRLVGELDLLVRARMAESSIRPALARLTELFDLWREPRHAQEVSDDGQGDPADSLAAGRPDALAPSPEEVLTREPGSSTEV